GEADNDAHGVIVPWARSSPGDRVGARPGDVLARCNGGCAARGRAPSQASTDFRGIGGRRGCSTVVNLVAWYTPEYVPHAGEGVAVPEWQPTTATEVAMRDAL